jgi:hypothetical protein
MSCLFARKNFQLPDDTSGEDVTKWQSLLHAAGLEGGASEDLDVFYSEDNRVIGVSIPIEKDLVLLLEAGEILGYVTAIVDQSSLYSPERWMSIHDDTGRVITSLI